MVFLSIVNFVRARGPDRFWNRRRTYMLSAVFKGRKRNCYSVALRNVHRALQFNRLSRPLKKQDMTDLREARISAGCEEHGLPYRWFHEGLMKADVFLNRKVLADLSIWEPRTFRAITKLAWGAAKEDVGPKSKGLNDLSSPPPGVYTKGMIDS